MFDLVTFNIVARASAKWEALGVSGTFVWMRASIGGVH
jgi:hypothetical protein